MNYLCPFISSLISFTIPYCLNEKNLKGIFPIINIIITEEGVFWKNVIPVFSISLSQNVKGLDFDTMSKLFSNSGGLMEGILFAEESVGDGVLVVTTYSKENSLKTFTVRKSMVSTNSLVISEVASTSSKKILCGYKISVRIPGNYIDIQRLNYVISFYTLCNPKVCIYLNFIDYVRLRLDYHQISLYHSH
jgi:DNA topoisomerase VI subunit B